MAISAKAVRLCLRRGNTAESAVPYMVFGAIFLGGVLGRYQTGYDFGRLSLALVERFGNRKQRAEVHFVVGYFGTSWLRPATEAEALWRTARAAGRETGDLFHTGCACAGIAQSQLMRGAGSTRCSRRPRATSSGSSACSSGSPPAACTPCARRCAACAGRPRVALVRQPRLSRGRLRRRARALRLAPLRPLLLRGQDAGALPVEGVRAGPALAVRRPATSRTRRACCTGRSTCSTTA